MKVSFWVILLALLVSSVPFLSFPDALDRAVIAVGGVLIMLLEGARMYIQTRDSLEQQEGLPEERHTTRSEREDKNNPRTRWWHDLKKRWIRKKGHETERNEDFNVYQL